jgi:hypothetical protein
MEIIFDENPILGISPLELHEPGDFQPDWPSFPSGPSMGSQIVDVPSARQL